MERPFRENQVEHLFCFLRGFGRRDNVGFCQNINLLYISLKLKKKIFSVIALSPFFHIGFFFKFEGVLLKK